MAQFLLSGTEITRDLRGVKWSFVSLGMRRDQYGDANESIFIVQRACESSGSGRDAVHDVTDPCSLRNVRSRRWKRGAIRSGDAIGSSFAVECAFVPPEVSHGR